MNAIFYAAGVIGGLVLSATPFIGRCRIAPRWIRLALWLAGPASVVWGVLGYSLLWWVRDPYGYVRNFKTLFGGMMLGILLLLVASDEFRRSAKGGGI